MTLATFSLTGFPYFSFPAFFEFPPPPGGKIDPCLKDEHGLGPVLFETISAFSTVGLSTGITADLPPAAQLVLVVLMFVGRLGPITFATALALRERQVLYQLPKERPIIG